jgi:hypothetical protein
VDDSIKKYIEKAIQGTGEGVNKKPPSSECSIDVKKGRKRHSSIRSDSDD